MSGLEELKGLSRRLAALMETPEPGLFSWQSALNSVLIELAQFSGENDVIRAAEAAKKRKKGL